MFGSHLFLNELDLLFHYLLVTRVKDLQLLFFIQ